MNWYAQAGKFTTANPQEQIIHFDKIHVMAESTEDAQTKVRDALENATDIFHVICHPDTDQEQTYHLIADTQERAEGWAKVVYRLENQ